MQCELGFDFGTLRVGLAGAVEVQLVEQPTLARWLAD